MRIIHIAETKENVRGKNSDKTSRGDDGDDCDTEATTYTTTNTTTGRRPAHHLHIVRENGRVWRIAATGERLRQPSASPPAATFSRNFSGGGFPSGKTSRRSRAAWRLYRSVRRLQNPTGGCTSFRHGSARRLRSAGLRKMNGEKVLQNYGWHEV